MIAKLNGGTVEIFAQSKLENVGGPMGVWFSAATSLRYFTGEHDVKSGEICQVLLHCDHAQSACGNITYDSLIDRLLFFDHGGVLS